MVHQPPGDFFCLSASLISFSFLASEQVNFLLYARWSQASTLPRKRQREKLSALGEKESSRPFGVQLSSLICHPQPDQVYSGAVERPPVLVQAAAANTCGSLLLWGSQRACPAPGGYLPVHSTQSSCPPIGGSVTGSPTETLLCSPWRLSVGPTL